MRDLARARRRGIVATMALCATVLVMPSLRGAGTSHATLWVVAPEEGVRLARVEASLPGLETGGEVRAMDIAAWMALFDAPGLSVAVFDDFRVVWAKT